MNNSFESIRKLALSKLSQFKFIMTIVMYLAAVIPLLSLGYLMGRTSAESSKWLLDLSSLLGSIGSLLGGLATVFAAWVAFGAYGAWKKQITHPEMFQNDMKIMKELAQIHQFHRDIIYFNGLTLGCTLKMYQNESGCVDLSEYNKIIDTERYNIYGAYAKLNPLYKLDNIVESVITVLDNTESFNFKIQKDIKEYFTLCEDIYDSLNKCVDYKHSDERVHNYMFYSSYFQKDINLISSINYEGEYYKELDVRFNLIKSKYSKRWGL